MQRSYEARETEQGEDKGSKIQREKVLIIESKPLAFIQWGKLNTDALG